MDRRLKRWSATGFVVALVLGALVVAPVGAQETRPREDGGGEVDLPAGTDVVSGYEEALAGEAEAQRRFEEASLRVLTLQSEVESLDRSIAAVQAELAAAQAGADEAEAARAAAEDRERRTEERLAQEEQRLRDQAVAAYVGGGATPTPNYAAALRNAASLNDLAKSRVYGEVVVEDREQVIARYHALELEAEAAREVAAQARDAAAGARDEVAGRANDLASQRDRLVQAQQESAQAATDRQRLGLEFEAQRRQYELRYASVLAASDDITGLLRARQEGQPPLITTYGILLNPIKDGKVVSDYGPRLHPILGIVRLHKGVDIDGGMGAPMRASLDGTVVFAEARGGYGLTVLIDHGNQVATLYAHMSSLSVAPGTVVRTGDVIGAVGSTGLSTGPHCHYEVRISGVPVNPVPYLMKTDPPLPTP